MRQIGAQLDDRFGKRRLRGGAALGERPTAAALAAKRGVDRLAQVAHVERQIVAAVQHVLHARFVRREQQQEHTALQRQPCQFAQTAALDVHALYDERCPSRRFGILPQFGGQIGIALRGERAFTPPQGSHVVGKLLHRGDGVLTAGGKAPGDGLQRVVRGARMAERAQAAQEREAHAAFPRHGVGQKELADFAGVGAVRRTAGAAIGALDGDDADGRGQPFGMLAQRQRGDGLLAVVAGGGHGQVPAGQLVGEAFHCAELLGRQGAVEIDRAIAFGQVEADIDGGKELVGAIGEQVFPGVLLHVVKTARPVDFRYHGLPRRQRAIDVVYEIAAPLVAAAHGRFTAREAEFAGVARLPAGVGEEDGAVEHDGVPVRLPLCGEYARVAVRQVAVGQIEAFGHGDGPSMRRRAPVRFCTIIAHFPRRIGPRREKFTNLYFLCRCVML